MRSHVESSLGTSKHWETLDTKTIVWEKSVLLTALTQADPDTQQQQQHRWRQDESAHHGRETRHSRVKKKTQIDKTYLTSWWQLCGQQQKCLWWWRWRCRALLGHVIWHPQKLHYIAVHEGNLWTTQQRHWGVEDWGKIKVPWVKY